MNSTDDLEDTRLQRQVYKLNFAYSLMYSSLCLFNRRYLAPQKELLRNCIWDRYQKKLCAFFLRKKICPETLNFRHQNHSDINWPLVNHLLGILPALPTPQRINLYEWFLNRNRKNWAYTKLFWARKWIGHQTVMRFVLVIALNKTSSTNKSWWYNCNNITQD